MIQPTTIDYGRSVLSSDLDAKPGDIRNSAHGDFASGQRRDHGHARAHGDFATGMRGASPPAGTGDFATGMRCASMPTETGDFATGMRAVSPASIRGYDPTSGRSSLPIAA